ncbi:MAG: type I restriction endonuclease [Gemmatimonadales bacterium]
MASARIIAFDDPGANYWLAVNQFAVVENKHPRCPDIVLFLNGVRSWQTPRKVE